MKFADTAYFLALLNPRDRWHAAARKASTELAEPLLSTDWVLTEVVDAMSSPRNRSKVVQFVRMLRQRSDVSLPGLAVRTRSQVRSVTAEPPGKSGTPVPLLAGR